MRTMVSKDGLVSSPSRSSLVTTKIQVSSSDARTISKPRAQSLVESVDQRLIIPRKNEHVIGLDQTHVLLVEILE